MVLINKCLTTLAETNYLISKYVTQDVCKSCMPPDGTLTLTFHLLSQNG